MTINFQFHIACIAFDPNVPVSALSLKVILDTVAKDLAESGDLRFVQSQNSASAVLTPIQTRYWHNSAIYMA
jgi:hypothetical protein